MRGARTYSQIASSSALKAGLIAKQAIGKIVDQILPPVCLVCGVAVGKNGACCPNCWTKLNLISEPVCPVMGSPFSVDLGDGIVSAEAIANPPPFERLRAVALYDDVARRLVSSLKFNDRNDLAPHMAAWMARAGYEILQIPTFIVPVPLHTSRLLSRRFNQSAELGLNVARNIGRPELFRTDLLKRHKPTKQQVGLSQGQRQRNVSGAFSVTRSGKMNLRGAKVVLVDDVYTTGATVKAATRTLLRAGVASVDVLVFAKVHDGEHWQSDELGSISSAEIGS